MEFAANEDLLVGFPPPPVLNEKIVAQEGGNIDSKRVIEVARALAEEALPAELHVSVLQGGLTNQLFLVADAPLANAKKGVLVRVYGRNTEVLIDREEEALLFYVLSQKGFGPQLHGLFRNGRVEGYIPCRAIEWKEMGQRSPIDFPILISMELARMHALEVPLNKQPHLWHFLHKFSEMASKVSFPGNDKDQERLEQLNLPALRKRLSRLEDELPSERNGFGRLLIEAETDSVKTAAMKFLFETVFCHNDLLAGNILFIQEENRLQLIDFEYSKNNFRGFDFGNHFCEYAGYDFDLAKWYPRGKAQRHFLQNYVKGASTALSDEINAVVETNADEFFMACVEWIDRFAIASNYLWGLWALLQRVYSPIDFDYLEYSRLRLSAIKLD